MTQFTNKWFRDTYLEEVKKRSPGSFVNAQMEIRNLMKFITIPFQELSMIEMQDYLVHQIDSKEIKKSTKNAKRYVLTAFFSYIQRTLLAYGIEFQNPVPSQAIYKFSTNLDDIKKVKDEDLKLLSIKQIEDILEYAFNETEFRDFLLMELAIISGARISELRTIQIENIDIQERSFQTGFIPGARKTTLHTKIGLLFFFPTSVAKHIGEYLEGCKKCEKWLFPGYRSHSISHTTAQDILQDIRDAVGFYFTWHYFRSSLITHRIENGCPKWISKGLTNHTPSDIQEKKYIKLITKKKREYYDQYFPYYSLPFFKK